MTILRTVCPSCDIVRVKAEDAVVRHHPGGDDVEVEFDCPDCTARVRQLINARMLSLLVSAGCVVDRPRQREDEGAISESEILAFVDELDRLDWADELAF